MTKTEAIAAAFKGTVIEDVGYRGVVFVPGEEGGQYLRYHARHGLHQVRRNNTKWSTVREVLTVDTLDDFLKQMGCMPTTFALNLNPLEMLSALLGGTIVQRFDAGGGVFQVGNDYIRASPIAGLDIVGKVLTKWRLTRHVWSKALMYRVCVNLPSGFVPQGDSTLEKLSHIRKEVTRHDGTDELLPDRGGDPSSDSTTCEAEGQSEEVPGNPEGEAGS